MQQKFSKNEQLILKALSNAIKKKRAKMNKSQRLFAFENGVHKSMISRFENCNNEPMLFSFWKMANALEIKPSELMKLLEKELPEEVSLLDI